MGWQDRDYASRTPYAGDTVISPASFIRSKSVVTILIWVNVIIFVLTIITQQPRTFSPFFAYGAMVPDYVLNGQVWRLVTSDYLHWSMGHIFMNMLGLYFLGQPLEQLWGPKRFFAVYSIAGIIGSAFYLLLTMMGWLPAGVAAGASGCVLGLLGAAAVLFPHARVYVYFLFPVKIRVLAVILGAWYVLNIVQSGRNAGGDACHIAGLAFGVWWAMKGQRWWDSSRRLSRTSTTARPGFKQRIAQRQADAQLIDRILEKVHSTGIHSLTDQEKRALDDATRRQRAQESQYEGHDRI